jgi:hypothetical protein
MSKFYMHVAYLRRFFSGHVSDIWDLRSGHSQFMNIRSKNRRQQALLLLPTLNNSSVVRIAV